MQLKNKSLRDSTINILPISLHITLVSHFYKKIKNKQNKTTVLYFWGLYFNLARGTEYKEIIWHREHICVTFVSVPNSQHSEDEGTEGSCKETSPVVPHGEERGRYFDAEQHTWNTRAETWQSRGNGPQSHVSTGRTQRRNKVNRSLKACL